MVCQLGATKLIPSTYPGKWARWTATTATWEDRNTNQKESLLGKELGGEMDFKMIIHPFLGGA